MAVVIDSLDKPLNVVATPVAGGNLVDGTTYYIIVTALNHDYSGYDVRYNSIMSEISTEITFVADSVNKSVQVDWDAVTGASYYNVYISLISGTYTRYDKCNGSRSTVNTNSYTITERENARVYSADTIINEKLLPCDIDRGKGFVNINLTGGDETLFTIAAALDAAGKSDHYYLDGTGMTFAVKGSINIASGVTGSLEIRYTTIYFIQGFFYNDSSDFDLTIGYESSGGTKYYGGMVYFSAYNNSLKNITAHRVKFVSAYSVILSGGTTIGNALYTTDSNAEDCSFEGVRNTTNDWSNNSLIAPNLLRAWGNISIYNTYYDTPIYLTYYARNGMHTFYDSIMKITYGNFQLQLAGYNYDPPQEPYPSAKFYDTDFEVPNGNTVNDIVFNISSAWESLVNGFDFYYSIQATILDVDGNLLDGVNVKCYDKDENLIFDDNTVDGILPKNYALVLGIRPTSIGTGDEHYDKISPNPYTLVISKTGYETHTSKFNLLKKFDDIITLNIEVSPIRVFEKYEVDYLPTPASLLRYVNPDTIPLKYVAPTAMNIKYVPQTQVLNIEYIPSEESTIRYIQPETIKIEYQCKP